jgi:hypothetical protein
VKHLLIKKQQLRVETGDESLTAAEQVYALAAPFSHRQRQLPLHDLLRKICDATRYPANSSSNALASCRSAVSKPSVNQP